MLESHKDYKRVKIIDKNKQRGYVVPEAREIRFYPAKLNTKMSIDYSNVLYSSVSDYYEVLNRDYFFVYENGKPILPNVPECMFTTDRGLQKTATITLDYKKFQDIYTKYLGIEENIVIDGQVFPNPDYPFDLKKVNYFCSNWNAINNKKEYSYWFVDSFELHFNNVTKEIRTITFNLVLDVYSEFHNSFWFYNGVVEVMRRHNPRWIEDRLYGTGYYIPDFSSQRFIRNCDEFCYNFNEKVQQTQTMPMISSRNWDAISETPIDSMLYKWDSDNWNAKVKTKKPIIFLICMRVDQFDEARGKEVEDKDKAFSYYQGEITNIGGYSEPYRYFAYIPTSDDGIPDQDELRRIVNKLNVTGVMTDDPESVRTIQKYRIISSIYMESIFDDKSFYPISPENDDIVNNTLYRIPFGKLDYFANKNRKEFYYFLEPINETYKKVGNTQVIDENKQQPYLWPKMFKTRDQIIGVETIDETNYDIEPHLFTNRHFSTDIGIFNKNGISFDISTLLINNNTAFEQAEIIQKVGGHYFAYKLLLRKGIVSSNMLDIKYFLLDQDTSVAYKRDGNVLTIDVVGNYMWPYYDNTYNEYVHNSQFRRQAGLDNIQQEYKLNKTNAWLNWGNNILGGTLGGLAGGLGVGRKAGITWKGGGIGAGLGLIGSGLGSILGQIGAVNQINAQKQMAERSLNAQYEDAKNQRGNANVGSSLTTQADMMFSAQLIDDIDERNVNYIWTPKVTFQQLKDYDCRTIAIYLNKMGYPQNQTVTIEKSLNELMDRFAWNRVAIKNPDEFLKKDKVAEQYCPELISAFLQPQGICFWNADTIDWDNIFNWTLHNYEKIFDLILAELETKVYG